MRSAEQISLEEGDFQEAPPSDIVAYNELRSCADLYRMFDDGVLDISPEFQREIAWKGPAQTRFIDSLTKQLPIPSLCFSYDYRNEKWQVIDGLQRIHSVIQFLDDKSDWVLSALDDIDENLKNRSVKDFQKKGTDLNRIKRRVENATLPITVLRCDPSLESHSNYLFMIFHRLNTGGIKLNNQEIRNCIFSGDLNKLLKDLDHNKLWLNINGLSSYINDRFKRQELILRFFAFHDSYESYKEGLAKFLNNYMRRNRKESKKSIEDKKILFQRTVSAISTKLGTELRTDKPNLSFFEALLVGVSRNIDAVENRSAKDMLQRFQVLKRNDEFSEVRLVEGLSKTVRVLGRLNAAVTTFRQ